MTDRPNLLLVIVDDLRPEPLGCFGREGAETPVMDDLAARGVTYTRCHTPTGWTLPACATIVTGRLPSGHGLVHHDRRFVAPKIPALLGDGWATCGIANNGNLVPDDISPEELDALGFERRPEVWKHFGWQEGFERYRWFHKEDRDGPFTAFAEWMDARTEDARPWFAMFHTNIVHDYDYDTPWATDVDRFHGGPLPASLRKFRDGPWIWKDPPEGLDQGAVNDAAHAKYEGCVAETDRRLGELLARVDFDRTVVCVVSDHGEGFDGERDRVHHCGRMHQDLLRVPLILIAPPGTPDVPPAGTRIDTPCSTIDVAPTLLRLGGAEPDGLPGEDLFDLPAKRELLGEDYGYLYLPPNDVAERLRRYDYRTHDVRLRSRIDWPHKRITARIGRQSWTEEYDLELDPHERVNLARGPHGPVRRPRREEGKVAAALRNHGADSDEAWLAGLPAGYGKLVRRIGKRRKLPPVARHRTFDEIPGAEPITFIVAVDDARELRHHVQASACYAHDAHQWLFVENAGNHAYASISRLYVDAAQRAKHDLRFHVHQDVLFPPDWEDRLFAALADLETRDPDWGVIGAAGRALRDGVGDGDGEGEGEGEPPNIGHWSDPHKYHKPRVDLPAEVQVLDELWLGTRASRGPVFDPELPGFHCYGADLCMAARHAGMKSYVIDAPVIHKLVRPDGSLIERSDQSHKIEGRRNDAFRADFRRSADHVARKWAAYLPFQSTCHVYE